MTVSAGFCRAYINALKIDDTYTASRYETFASEKSVACGEVHTGIRHIYISQTGEGRIFDEVEIRSYRFKVRNTLAVFGHKRAVVSVPCGIADN